MDVDSFLQAFITWVSKQQGIEGVALVGSRARDAATEHSDVDLIVRVLIECFRILFDPKGILEALKQQVSL